MSKIEELFQMIKKWGFITRSNKMNGLERWNTIKDILSKSKVKGEWNSRVKELFVEMRSTLKIQECKDEFKGTPEEIQREWEKHHFYLQHTRIPTLNYTDASLTRLMQIAYNAGQLEVEINNDFYRGEKREFYEGNKLDDIHTYMDENSLNILDQSITDEIMGQIYASMPAKPQNGGSDSKYEYKYLKYKQKYLSEKMKYMGISYDKFNNMQGI